MSLLITSIGLHCIISNIGRGNIIFNESMDRGLILKVFIRQYQLNEYNENCTGLNNIIHFPNRISTFSKLPTS